MGRGREGVARAPRATRRSFDPIAFCRFPSVTDHGPADPRSTPGTILVVDDVTDLRTLLAVALEDEGYAVVEARSGKEALAAIQTHHPDLVLLDVVLPDADGLQILGQIHREDPTISVIMLSGLDDEARAQSAISLGAIGYLCKPISLDHLERVVLDGLLARRAPSGAADGAESRP